MNEELIFLKLREQRILPLFYHTEAAVCVEITKALYDAGIRMLEFTNRGSDARENARSIFEYRNNHCKDLLIGVGTVSNQEDAVWFIENGADFLVSPFFDSAVCDIAYLHKITWIPGCMTPSEIHTARKAGCKLIKLFPGDVLGTNFLKAIQPIFNELSFIVTGGVEANIEDINSWLKSGVDAVGLGSKLITKELIHQRDYSKLTEEVALLLNGVVKKSNNK